MNVPGIKYMFGFLCKSNFRKTDKVMNEQRIERERQILCAIFPEVVWLSLCNWLINYPDVLQSLYHASAFLQRLLQSQRTKLFLSSLLDYGSIPGRKSKLEQAITSGNFRPFCFNAQPTLRQLRLVCKTWCAALEKTVYLQSVNSNSISYDANTLTRIGTVDDYPDRESQFMSHFERSHPPGNKGEGSPFISNAVHLHWRKNTDYDNQLDEFNPSNMPFQRLLKGYGQHILYCKLFIFRRNAPAIWYEAAILEILRHMPNLVKLNLTLPPQYDGKSSEAHQPFSDLPTLVHARVLIVSQDDKGVGHEFVSNLVSRMPSIKEIQVNLDSKLDEVEMNNIFPDASLQNPKQLEFPHKGFCYVESRMENPVLPNNFRLHSIFRTLEAHSPLEQLSTLQMDLPCTISSTWEELKHYKINVPNLRSFKLVLRHWGCIDMVLMFNASLKDLSVCVNPPETLETWSRLPGAENIMGKECIEFLICYGTLDKDSNIWRKMPHLKAVSVVIAIGSDVTSNKWERLDN